MTSRVQTPVGSRISQTKKKKSQFTITSSPVPRAKTSSYNRPSRARSKLSISDRTFGVGGQTSWSPPPPLSCPYAGAQYRYAPCPRPCPVACQCPQPCPMDTEDDPLVQPPDVADRRPASGPAVRPPARAAPQSAPGKLADRLAPKADEAVASTPVAVAARADAPRASATAARVPVGPPGRRRRGKRRAATPAAPSSPRTTGGRDDGTDSDCSASALLSMLFG